MPVRMHNYIISPNGNKQHVNKKVCIIRCIHQVTQFYPHMMCRNLEEQLPSVSISRLTALQTAFTFESRQQRGREEAFGSMKVCREVSSRWHEHLTYTWRLRELSKDSVSDQPYVPLWSSWTFKIKLVLLIFIVIHRFRTITTLLAHFWFHTGHKRRSSEWKYRVRPSTTRGPSRIIITLFI